MTNSKVFLQMLHISPFRKRWIQKMANLLTSEFMPKMLLFRQKQLSLNSRNTEVRTVVESTPASLFCLVAKAVTAASHIQENTQGTFTKITNI